MHRCTMPHPSCWTSIRDPSTTQTCTIWSRVCGPSDRGYRSLPPVYSPSGTPAGYGKQMDPAAQPTDSPAKLAPPFARRAGSSAEHDASATSHSPAPPSSKAGSAPTTLISSPTSTPPNGGRCSNATKQFSSTDASGCRSLTEHGPSATGPTKPTKNSATNIAPNQRPGTTPKPTTRSPSRTMLPARQPMTRLPTSVQPTPARLSIRGCMPHAPSTTSSSSMGCSTRLAAPSLSTN